MTKSTKAKEPATPAVPEAEEKLSPKEEKEVRAVVKVIESREIATSDAFGKLTRSQVDLIKRTVAKGASDDELRLFIQVCKGAQLNPFMKQVHLVPRWDSKLAMEVRTIQVGIDGFRAVAESSGQYAGNDDPVYEGEKDVEYGEKKKKISVPLKATATVYKLMAGQRFGFTATARWEEYYPGSRMGFQWHVRPYLMLGKCAEALALRKAFPKLLSGMYAQEEMDRGAAEGAEQEKSQKGFQAVRGAIEKATLKELEEYKVKMAKSEKYTGAQKDEFAKLVEARIADLKQLPKEAE